MSRDFKDQPQSYQDELEETQVAAEELYRIDARRREVEDQAAGHRDKPPVFHPLNADELEQRRIRRGRGRSERQGDEAA